MFDCVLNRKETFAWAQEIKSFVSTGTGKCYAFFRGELYFFCEECLFLSLFVIFLFFFGETCGFFSSQMFQHENPCRARYFQVMLAHINSLVLRLYVDMRHEHAIFLCVLNDKFDYQHLISQQMPFENGTTKLIFWN